MSLHSDTPQKTVAPKTVEELRRAPRPIHTPQWLLPVAVILFALVAGIVGVSLLRSDDTTTTESEPLIVPEEQAFIDARTRPLAPTPTVTETPPADISERPQGVPGMLEYYELEFIQATTPSAIAPSPASVGFTQLMTPEELAFDNGEYFNEAVEDWCLTHTPC